MIFYYIKMILFFVCCLKVESFPITKFSETIFYKTNIWEFFCQAPLFEKHGHKGTSSDFSHQVCHIQYKDPPEVQTKYKQMWSHMTKWPLCALWNANAWPDGEPNFRLQGKQKQACFLKLCKECPFLSVFCLLPSSVCGSVSADKTPLGGGTDVALISIWALYPCSSHSRCSTQDTPHSQLFTARGCSHKKRTLFRTFELDAAFTHVTCEYVWQREIPVSYRTGSVSSFEVFPLCFNTLLSSWLSLSHTHPFEKQTQMTEMHQYDVS